MEKISLSTGISTFPMPAAVISVGIGDEAPRPGPLYSGQRSSPPPIIAISIQPKRHSYKLIEKHGEFVINYPTKNQLKEMDYCGTRSGRDVNKWKELNLTKEQGTIVQVPMVKEFPWNMECKVIKRVELGSHVCYLGEVVATHSDEQFLSNKRLDPEKFNCFAYVNGNYIGLEKGVLEKHGFSMQ